MMRSASTVVALALTIVPASVALSDDGPPPGVGAQTKAFSPVMAGMVGGVICNMKIDRGKAAAYIKDQIGSKETFDVDQVVYLTWMAYAQQAMQAEMGVLPKGKPAMKAYCASMTKAFGINGTTVRGLLE